MKRYVLTRDTRKIGNTVLHRIRAIKDFDIVNAHVKRDRIIRIKQGTLGGWVEREENLNQDSLAWVMDDACVYGNAVVTGASIVSGKANVHGDARIEELAFVTDEAEVYGNAYIAGQAEISGSAMVENGVIFDNAKLFDSARLHGGAQTTICENAKVYGSACIWNDAYDDDVVIIDGNALVYENASIIAHDGLDTRIYVSATVCGHATLNDCAYVFGNATVTGYTCLSGGAIVGGNAYIDLPKKCQNGYGLELPPRANVAADAYITTPDDCLVVGMQHGEYCSFNSITFFPNKERKIFMKIGGPIGVADYLGPLEDPATMRETLRNDKILGTLTEQIVAATQYAHQYYSNLEDENLLPEGF